MIRPALPEDAPFVASGFLRSFRGSIWAGPVPSEMFWDTYGQAFSIAAARPGMRTLVALVEGVLVGFATAAPPDVLVYTYVKPKPVDYRRAGIMTALLDAIGLERSPGRRIRCCYMTECWRSIAHHTGWRCDYTPELVRAPPRREANAEAH